ncbi:sensor histidine kinase [Pelagibaculum spongiae]|uniref:histidine kinase n=1 Tax=Pelagibaculum spongiae TaxID=2080658 RepID=A0A2V1GZ27_9GAMM|nr:ATP-binding protein [Pelagibaculum spongiae]PVZ72304.1 hypothetical protein DC094_04665 [Pelagibaculum spongiae]
MTFSLSHLFFAGGCYLALLFAIAWATDKGIIPSRITSHPITFTLALGVYFSAWSFYGVFGYTLTNGYNYLGLYLGITGAFILAPVLMTPILRLTRTYQLSSLADLFAFRYRSQLVGLVVTLGMIAALMPYLALQVQALINSIQVLTGEQTPDLVAVVFCTMIFAFCVFFGARHFSFRQQHQGLVAAIAFESLVKLIALICAGVFAIFGVFGGFNEMGSWLQQNPQMLDMMYQPLKNSPWPTLLMLSFLSTVLLPHIFHMTFNECKEERNFLTVSWLFPTMMLVMCFSVPPIIWAALNLNSQVPPDYLNLGMAIAANAPWLAVLLFLGGLSAASAMLVVTTLALATMALNHIFLPSFHRILPALENSHQRDFYKGLLWARRAMIFLIISLCYGMYLLMRNNHQLMDLGNLSAVALAQLSPGLIGVLYWRRATRAGLLSGLLGGAIIWLVLLLLPDIFKSGIVPELYNIQLIIPKEYEPWRFATLCSLLVNGTLFITISLLTKQGHREQHSAAACAMDNLQRPHHLAATPQTPLEFCKQLEPRLGIAAANREIRQACTEAGIELDEQRSWLLQRMVQRLEINLSGLLGPSVADDILRSSLWNSQQAQPTLSDIRLAEEHIKLTKPLRGIAGELDSLRRYHRTLLQSLPVGVCSLNYEQDILIWNDAMGKISCIASKEVTGGKLANLPWPWDQILGEFYQTEALHKHKLKLEIDNRPRWFNLHKAFIGDYQSPREQRGVVILVEDLTHLQLLEVELAHSERLASIGQLAAGVAHEIGNPVTCIDSLAQIVLPETDDEFVKDCLMQMREQTKRITDIVQSLVTFSHSGNTRKLISEPVALCECVKEAVKLARLSLEGKQMEYSVNCDDSIVLGDPQLILQVLLNLLNNARDASQPGDMIEINIHHHGGQVITTVKDQGTGIDPQNKSRLFEPFFTTKEPGKGTGLGLPLVYSIIDDHQGQIVIDNAPEGGAVVTIRLPLYRSEHCHESYIDS